MTERERFAAEILLASWAALAVVAVLALAIGTALERSRDEVAQLRNSCVCVEVQP